MKTVRLTDGEMLFAGIGGCQRQISALADDREDQFAPRDAYSFWGVHILGAMAEAAVAKRLNRYWTPLYDSEHVVGSPDLDGIETRCSPNPSAPLRVRPRDKENGKEDSVFVLVIVEPPDFHLVGWLRGHEAMVDVYWQEKPSPPSLWEVPQEALRAIS